MIFYRDDGGLNAVALALAIVLLVVVIVGAVAIFNSVGRGSSPASNTIANRNAPAATPGR
jgi:Flp pilus assembly protein TadG